MPAKHIAKNAYKHRRQKLGRWQLLSYFTLLLGNQLYYIGATVERSAGNAKRRIRRGTAAFKGWLLKSLGAASAAAAGFFTVLFRDITAPFAVFFGKKRKLAKMKKTLTEDEYLKASEEYLEDIKASHGKRRSRFINAAAPIACTLLMVLILVSIFNMNFVLKLSINDQMVGYVSEEKDYNEAKRMLQSRMVSVDGTKWSDNTKYTLAVVRDSDMTETYKLADNILLASGEDITEGTGVFVGGVYLGCTTDTEKIYTKIDTLIKSYSEQVSSLGNAVVKFKHNVELTDGIFPTSGLKDYSYFESMIDENPATDLIYTYEDGDDLEKLASSNGLTLDELKAMNPSVNFQGLSSGTKLYVSRGEGIFSVKTLVVETYIETIPYDTTVIPDVRYDVGYVQIVTRGSVGENKVTVEIEYQNGREISREVIETIALTEVVNEQMIVGTKPLDGTTVGAIGTGYLSWPTGDYLYIFRGWIGGVHRGIDITAARGTPVYAADNGIVEYAGWHGYGNTGFGNYVMINHNNSMTTHYAHLDGYIVKVGDVVTKGQVIGFVGSTGNSSGYHLHFAIQINGVWQPTEPYLYGEAHM